jgi:hypothetical protein
MFASTTRRRDWQPDRSKDDSAARGAGLMRNPPMCIEAMGPVPKEEDQSALRQVHSTADG